MKNRSQRTLLAFGVAVALVAALSSLSAGAQDKRRQSKRFTDTTSVVVVEIPVQVLDKGRPVRGLTADNFEVIDGRRSRPLIGFDVIDLDLVDRTVLK